MQCRKQFGAVAITNDEWEAEYGLLYGAPDIHYKFNPEMPENVLKIDGRIEEGDDKES